MYLLTEETMLMVGQRSAIKEVNDWAHNTFISKTYASTTTIIWLDFIFHECKQKRNSKKILIPMNF